MSDVVDHCRRITRMAEVSLMVDAEDGFGNAANVRRTVQELEAAGVAAIEIEDNVVPRRFNVQNPGLVSKAEQVSKLQAAVAARTDPRTVIVARTSALAACPLEEALDRIRAYATTGAEALMLAAGPHGRVDIAAVHQATFLPATASAEGAQLNGRPSPCACSILLQRRGTTRPSLLPMGSAF
jgi:carboxyvinyl-carboxyphosphonate phosphorylmutase